MSKVERNTSYCKEIASYKKNYHIGIYKTTIF